MLQFGVSGLVLCTCAFQLAVVSPSGDFAKFMFVLIYSVCMVIEVYIPCYYGSVVIEKSRRLTDSIYASDWINQDQTFKSSLLILVSRTFKPLATSAGGLYVLNLTTFMSVRGTSGLPQSKHRNEKTPVSDCSFGIFAIGSADECAETRLNGPRKPEHARTEMALITTAPQYLLQNTSYSFERKLN